MKLIHRIKASILLHRIKGQHRKLDRFIQESARDICAWRQEISYLESDARLELELAGIHRAATISTPEDLSGKVVSIDRKAA